MSWIALIGALVVLLAIDLLVVRGRGGEMSLRAASVASATPTKATSNRPVAVTSVAKADGPAM